MLDELERRVRYSLDLNEEMALFLGPSFRHGMLGSLADWTSSSIISQLGRHGPGVMLDMRLSFMSALQAPSNLKIESRIKSRGDTLVSVATHFYSDGREMARAKTVHYVAPSPKRTISKVEEREL